MLQKTPLPRAFQFHLLSLRKQLLEECPPCEGADERGSPAALPQEDGDRQDEEASQGRYETLSSPCGAQGGASPLGEGM